MPLELVMGRVYKFTQTTRATLRMPLRSEPTIVVKLVRTFTIRPKITGTIMMLVTVKVVVNTMF